MPIVTPDVEAHLIARIVALVGGAPPVYVASGDGENITPGPEQPVGGRIKLAHTFVRRYAERRRLFYGGQGREFLCQIVQRFAHDGPDDQRRAAARVKVDALYDAIHLSGGFTAAGGVLYLDIRAIDAPNELQPAYFATNVAVWHNG